MCIWPIRCYWAVSYTHLGEAGDQWRDVAAGGVDLDGNGDSVAVVFDDEEDGELEVRGGTDGFPELTFAGSAITEGDIDDFVAMEIDLAELAVCLLYTSRCV